MKRHNRDRGLTLVILTTFLYFFTLGVSTSIIARYSRELGMNIGQVGIVWSITFLAAVFFRPIAGHYGDKISSFSMMALGSVLLGISNIVFTITQTSFGLSVGRFLTGIGNAFFITTSIAAASLVVPIDRSGVALSYRAAAVSFGTFVAPPIAGYIVDIWGYVWAFRLAVVMAIVNTVLCLVHRENKETSSEDHFERHTWRSAFNTVVILATVLAIFGGGLFSGFRGLIQTHYRDLGYPSSYYGLIMAMFSGISTITRLFVPKLTKEDPNKSYLLAVAGYMLLFAGTGLLVILYQYPESFIVAAIYGVGFGFIVPTIQHLISYYTERAVRNRAMAIYAIGFDVGGFVGGLTFSYTAEFYGYVSAYLAMIFFPITNIVIMFLYNTLLRRSRNLREG